MIEARTALIEAEVEARMKALEPLMEAQAARAEASAMAQARLSRVSADAGPSAAEIRAIRESARQAAADGARAAEDAQRLVADLQPQINAVTARALALAEACKAGTIDCDVYETD